MVVVTTADSKGILPVLARTQRELALSLELVVELVWVVVADSVASTHEVDFLEALGRPHVSNVAWVTTMQGIARRRQ